MSTWRRFTIKVVAMTAGAEAPAASMETAMNCALPANTMMDMRPISKGVNPAFCAKTPNAVPMGR